MGEGRAGAGVQAGALAEAPAAERPLGLLEKEERAQTNAWDFNGRQCRFEGLAAYDFVNGDVSPSRLGATCKNPRCKRCGRAYIGRTFALARLALDYSQRARLVTYTLASQTDADSWTWPDWQEARRVQRQNLRRKGFRYESLNVIEAGSENGRQHMHDVQHGSFIPKEVLSASWPYGMTNIRSSAGAAATYLSKNALPYLAKETDGDDQSLIEHMRRNGGRAEHHTTGFFNGHGRDVFARQHPFIGPSQYGVIDLDTGALLEDEAIARLRNIGGKAARPIPALSPVTTVRRVLGGEEC